MATCEQCGGHRIKDNDVCKDCHHINGYAEAQQYEAQRCPSRCPECGSGKIAPGVNPDWCEYDDRWAYLDAWWAEYIYDEIICSGCGGVFTYGPRWYLNSEDGEYISREPSVPRKYWTPEMEAALARQQRQAQIEAGQLLLPGVD